MKKPKLMITQGHRGARGMLPENSLAGIAYAIDAGVDRVEIDINLTADDALIVVHDETTNPDIVRDAGGHWFETRTPWRSLDSTSVRRLDVGRIRPGSRYAERFAAQSSHDGTRIPLLEDVFELLRERDRGGVTIEIKCAPHAPQPRPDVRYFADLVAVAVDRAGFRQRATIQSFNWSMVAAVRELDPGLTTGCLTSEHPELDTIRRRDDAPSPWTNGLRVADFNGSVPDMVAAMGVAYWSAEHRDLDAASIDAAHALGLDVHTWTVNDPEMMKKLIICGVDSMISDYPDALLEVAGVNN
ncbi:MAG: glycerophosphodiester phosphodiesterase [Proteobacteria bacterium]|nr:MAG: glycerophosphodiester phosphodiesterase [Pseudomonadota bacterium]